MYSVDGIHLRLYSASNRFRAEPAMTSQPHSSIPGSVGAKHHRGQRSRLAHVGGACGAVQAFACMHFHKVLGGKALERALEDGQL